MAVSRSEYFPSVVADEQGVGREEAGMRSVQGSHLVNNILVLTFLLMKVPLFLRYSNCKCRISEEKREGQIKVKTY